MPDTPSPATATATVTPADALFRPRSIAVIGASSDATRIGGRPIDYTLRAGYTGALYPVNPRGGQLQGLRAYASVADIPGNVDLALVALPADAAVQAVEDCIAKGVRAIAMFSAGFAEVSAAGREQQDRMRDRCRAAGVLLLGPNCLGFMNIGAGVMLTFSTVLENIWPKPGRVSMVSQSGAVGAYSAALAMERGIGLDKWVTTGNEADIDVARCIEWLADEPDTGPIMAYLEGCKDMDRLRAALAKAASRGKPVLMLKPGSSPEGMQAITAHTGSDAGDEAAYARLFRETGTLRMQSMEQQVDTAYAFANGVFPRSPRIATISISGGVGVLMADAAARAGLQLPTPPAEVQQQIKALIPFSSPFNPYDVTAQIINDMGLFNRILALVAAQDEVDTVFIFLLQLGKVDSHFLGFRDALLEARRQHPHKLFVLCGGYSPNNRASMEAAGFLVFEEPVRAVQTVAALVRPGQPTAA